MFTSSVAFEIGGAFLLAALVMYGTMNGGFIPKTFQRFKYGGIVLVVAILAAAGYRFLPEISAMFDFTPPTPPTSSAPTPAAPTSSVPPSAVRTARHEPKPVQRAAIIDNTQYVSAQANPQPPPPAVATPAPEPPAEPATPSRGKRALRSIGRALHITHTAKP